MTGESASLDPVELGAYFALIEVSSLLRHAVELQLKEAGAPQSFPITAPVLPMTADIEQQSLEYDWRRS